MSTTEEVTTTTQFSTTFIVFPSNPDEKSNWFSDNPTLTTVIVFVVIVLGGIIYVKFCGKKKNEDVFNNDNLHADNSLEPGPRSTAPDVPIFELGLQDSYIVKVDNTTQECNQNPPQIGGMIHNAWLISQMKSNPFRYQIRSVMYSQPSHSVPSAPTAEPQIPPATKVFEDLPPPYSGV